MSYRIDGETPYWGGLSVPCKEREYPDAWDLVFKETTRILEESRKPRKEWSELENKLRNKLEQMEMEKKVNKMTKAEAFEWLKGKRVICDNFNSVDIQCKFFEVGVKWRGGSTEVSEDVGHFLFVDLNGCLTHCNSRTWFDAHEYEEISAEEILSLEIVEEYAKDDEDPYFVGCIKELQETLEDDEVLIITKTNFLTMKK